MSSDDRTLPALSTRSRRRNRERWYDRFPSRKCERSPTTVESHAAFLPSTKPKGANKELRTRAAAFYKKRDHFSRGRTKLVGSSEHVTRWRAEISPPRFFPRTSGEWLWLTLVAATVSLPALPLYRVWQIRRLGTRTELIESTLREYVQSWGITSRHWQLHFISPRHF